MSNTTTNRVLHLTPDQWQRLDTLAVETDSREHPGRGRDPRVAKWTRLIRRIADGQITLVENDPYQLPAGLAGAAAAIEERERLEQARLEQQRRVEAHTAAKQAVRKTPVKLEQMNMLTELEPA